MVKAWNAFADSRGNGVGGITFAPLPQCRDRHRTNPVPLVPAPASNFASYPETDPLSPTRIRAAFRKSKLSSKVASDHAAKWRARRRAPVLRHTASRNCERMERASEPAAKSHESSVG